MEKQKIFTSAKRLYIDLSSFLWYNIAYNDVTIRRLVEYIRVMKDNSIIIVLKGGMKIQENI